MDILSFFKKKQEVKENSYFPTASSFPINSRTHKVSILDYLNTASLSYHITMSVGLTNPVIASFTNLVSGSLGRVTLVDGDDNEIDNPATRKILKEVYDVFGENDSLRAYSYTTLLNYLASGMKVSAPIEVDDRGNATRIEYLDPRYITINYSGSGGKVVSYKGKELVDYYQYTVKPNMNRRGYGDCVYSSVVKDAIMTGGILDTAIAHYDNKAEPSLIFKLKDEVSDPAYIEQFQKDLHAKYGGNFNAGKPMATNIIDDVKVIDASASVIKSIESRHLNNNSIALSLNIDLRALGYMRDGGSQAEMTEVYNQANHVIKNRSEVMSSNLTQEYSLFVRDLGKYKIKFLPNYIYSKQKLIENAFMAVEKGLEIDREWVLNLVYNQSV